MITIGKIKTIFRANNTTKSSITELASDMALETLNFCMVLDNMKKWSLSNNIIRTSLSVEANIEEAGSARNQNDFIHKMKIAAKEAVDLEYYLEICRKEEKLAGNVELINQVKVINTTINHLLAV